MFTSEQAFGAKSSNRAKRSVLTGGITLAKSIDVKKVGIFRIITVGIGILVAMLIALTLWMRMPGEHPSGELGDSRESTLPFAASNLLETIQSALAATPEP